MASHRHAPRDCPVCGEQLELTRLSCDGCGTELSGVFSACEFCALTEEDRSMLRVFLASRGNMKDLERHLGVSYPTARARFDGLLARLGLKAADAPPDPTVELLEALARGDVGVEEALGSQAELARRTKDSASSGRERLGPAKPDPRS